MELLNPVYFASIKASSSDLLNRIARNYIAKYLSSEQANTFISACNNLDYKTSNEILDRTIKAISGYESVTSAILAFADKFPSLQIDMADAYTEPDKVQRLSENSDNILLSINHQIKRRRKMNILAVCIAIFIFIIVVGVCFMFFKPKFVTSEKKKNQKYTQKDRDMITLIIELSEIYRKTEEYLKK